MFKLNTYYKIILRPYLKKKINNSFTTLFLEDIGRFVRLIRLDWRRVDYLE